MSRYRFFWAVAILMAACQSTHVAPINTTSQPLALDADERQLWEEARSVERRIEEVGLVYSNMELEAYIRSVAVQLSRDRLENPETELRVQVLRVPYRNAFAFPNGVLYITTGMLACLDNEAELASVLGHEMTHFIRRHSLKQSRSAANKRLWVNIFGGTTALVGLGPVINSVGSAWAASTILGYSRDLENEADEQGLEAVVRAGYGPSVSVNVFEYLREEDELEMARNKMEPSTHPQAQERVEHYRELLATRYAVIAGAPGKINREKYLEHVQQLLLDNARLDVNAQRLDFAANAVEKYIAIWPDSSPGYFWRGEISRRRHEPRALTDAEVAYCMAVQLDPQCAEAHRELGLLYRAAGRLQEARNQFANYVTLNADAIDCQIIQRYVAELDTELAQASSQ